MDGSIGTLRNATSSRSHAIIRIAVRESDIVLLSAGAKHATNDGKLFLVDLAGVFTCSLFVFYLYCFFFF
jgi:hypothetical protein